MTVEVVVAMLIAWAVGKANRVGREINGLTDEALDLTVERMRNVVASKLGQEMAVRRLLEEARATNGAVSEATKSAAAQALRAAIAQDSRFAAQVQQVTAPPPAPGSYTNMGDVYGVQGVTQHGDGSIKISNKVVNQARRHPVAAALIVAALLALLGISVDRLMNDAKVATPTSSPTAVGEPNSLAGKSVDSQTIVGAWNASDGTGTKTFTASSGQCAGFYYNNGKPLDIGGPMTCTISSKPDAQGRYTMIVTQSENRATFHIAFTDTDHASVLDSQGTKIYEIERF